jgi:hypothetical protein
LLLLFASAFFCVALCLSLEEKEKVFIKEINRNLLSMRCMKHLPW